MQDNGTRATLKLPGRAIDGGLPEAARGSPTPFAWADKTWRPLLVTAALVALAVAALAVDYPLALWTVEGNCPAGLLRLLRTAEPFGHAIGVLLIVAAIYQLDPIRRWALPRVLAMSLGAGLAADVLKLVIARARPHQFDFQGGVTDTFGQWLPLFGGGAGSQSFPSAHTATAVGLAVALVWLYPRGCWLFVTLAVLVACERVAAAAHYLSDTLCGAALGFVVAMACLKVRRLVGPFERLEGYLKSLQRQSAQALVGPEPEERLPSEPADEDVLPRAA